MTQTNSQVKRKIAFYKLRSTGSSLRRTGPLQTVRNCTRCASLDKSRTANLFGVTTSSMSYDNLITRRGLWFTGYHSIQYHPGQLEVLKRAIENQASSLTIFIVGLVSKVDLKWFYIVLKSINIVDCELLSSRMTADDVLCSINRSKSIVIPFNNALSLPNDPDLITNMGRLQEILKIIFSLRNKNKDIRISVAPVSIAKDDRLQMAYKGSLCVQICEPYDLQDYMKNIQAEVKSEHLAIHMVHDIRQNTPILPTSVIAYLVVNMDDGEGVRLQDVAKVIDWLREISVHIDLHLTFTGDSRDVVEYGLRLLRDTITRSSDLAEARDIDKLRIIAFPVTSCLLRYSLLVRSILDEINDGLELEILTNFRVDSVVKVAVDDVIERFKAYLINIQSVHPTKPCIDIDTTAGEILHQIQVFGHFFKIIEPSNKAGRLLAWAGDSDTDDDYYYRNSKRPEFRSWLILTRRPDRVKLLNVLLNAVEMYFLSES